MVLQLVLEPKDGTICTHHLQMRTLNYHYLKVSRPLSMQVYLLDAKDPEQAPQRVEPRRSDVEYFVEHHDGFLYILTNSGLGCNYQLVQCPVDSTSSKHWQVLSSYQLVSAVSLLYSILWLTSDFFF